ncbi:hypothetical protein M109_0659 [Bacteroides fragilis str. 3397 N2]|nr:hypothetical protein M109_0659 [Bacteroides fragilis str. 3397 N2]EYA43436.1 hypothetical protein M110_1899 [Bacteroides fragilis str. 3397 N3]
MRICNSDTALSLIPGTFAYNINHYQPTKPTFCRTIFICA